VGLTRLKSLQEKGAVRKPKAGVHPAPPPPRPVVATSVVISIPSHPTSTQRKSRLRDDGGSFIAMSTFAFGITLVVLVGLFSTLNSSRVTPLSSLPAEVPHVAHLVGYRPFFEDVEPRIASDLLLARSRGLVHQLIPQAGELHQEIINSALYYEVPITIALAMAEVESGFRPRAVGYNRSNNSYDRGLFQLNSLSFHHLSTDDFFDPATNTNYALEYLSSMYEEFGDWESAIIAYNQGPSRLKRGIIVPSTAKYLEKVLLTEKRYHEKLLSGVPLLSMGNSFFPGLVLEVSE